MVAWGQASPSDHVASPLIATILMWRRTNYIKFDLHQNRAINLFYVKSDGSDHPLRDG